jgi:hypothetical protein
MSAYVLKRRGHRVGSIAALSVLAAFAFAGCTSDGESKVSVAALGATTSSSLPTDTITTSSQPSIPTSTSTTTLSTEPSPQRDGFPVDPTAYIRERDYEDLARAGEVELPTWLPAWAGAAKPIVIAVRPFEYTTAWTNPDGVEPTTGEEVHIDVSRGREPSHDDALPWELPPQTIQGTTRTYHTLYGDRCPPKGVIRDGPVLWWRVPGYTYSVSVYPWPGCAPGFSIRDAVIFADSLVPCRVNADSLDCSTKPS